MLLTANNFGLQEEDINVSKPQGKTIRKTGWGTTKREERQVDRKRERNREGGCSPLQGL